MQRLYADENCYSAFVRELVRKNLRFFVFAALAAIALRLLFVFRFPAITTDSFVYGDIAKNWLQHGIYGLSGRSEITPTYIRLPGYPAFLAAVFAVFGMEHYRAALLLQILVDVGTCFLIADLARRLSSTRAAKSAFLLSALCPFFANYAAAALTETWEIFFTALALDIAVIGLNSSDVAAIRAWTGCGLAIGTAMLLRPDGGLLLASVEVYLGWLFLRRLAAGQLPTPILRAAVIVAIAAVAPLAPWTLRNLHTLHQFQPLAPRYANDPNTFVARGFNRWTKTWIADYASVEEVYWAATGSPIDADNLPVRAFDTPEQQDQTEQLIDDYNQSLHLTPDLDARFARLATERMHRAPLRYYLWLPLVRVADMWLRPRTEILPCNTRWWEFDEERKWLVLSLTLGVINLLYIGAVFLGLIRGRFAPHLALLLTFVILRSAFLGTLENPEPRYTLECYPVVIILAAALLAGTKQ
jgi:4-amino-4-deoxy-L-arabinose transferase-like glycosyltransferase